MSFTDRANSVRKSIPFAYWLMYDIVLLPFLVWASLALSPWFGIPISFLLVAMFFDINEAVVKWVERG